MEWLAVYALTGALIAAAMVVDYRAQTGRWPPRNSWKFVPVMGALWPISLFVLIKMLVRG